MRVKAIAFIALLIVATWANASESRFIRCSGTQPFGTSPNPLNVFVNIALPESLGNMLVVVNAETNEVVRNLTPVRGAGEGIIEIVEGIGDQRLTPQSWPITILKLPSKNMSMMGLFFAGDEFPATIQANLWQTPKRFTLTRWGHQLATGICE